MDTQFFFSADGQTIATSGQIGTSITVPDMSTFHLLKLFGQKVESGVEFYTESAWLPLNALGSTYATGGRVHLLRDRPFEETVQRDRWMRIWKTSSTNLQIVGNVDVDKLFMVIGRKLKTS